MIPQVAPDERTPHLAAPDERAEYLAEPPAFELPLPNNIIALRL